MFSGLRKQLRRVSIRLTLWHALLFLTAALTVLGLTYVVLQARLIAQERDVIEFRLKQYAGEYERGGVRAVRLLAALRKGRDQRAFFIRIADPKNHTLFLRDAEDWAEFSPQQLEQETPPLAGDDRALLTLDSPAGKQLLLGSLRLPDGGWIQVGESTEALQSLLAGFRTATFVVLLIFLPTSIVGGSFLASRALRPVQHLTSAAERIVATGSFDARVPARGTADELDALVLVFNEMLSRIERLIHGMRDSLDNVAHDLRTPMTRLRQHAQSALQGPEEPGAIADALAECVEEAERVMTLLNTLMDIAEAESGLVTLQRAPVEIGELARGAVDYYVEVAEEKSVAVTTELAPELCVSGEANALRRVLANLLDNAIKYTPAGGCVRITAQRVRDFVEVRFTDTGVGISEEDLPRVWDRLFRGTKSRTERGLGLGLSFVRAIVQSHGGAVWIESAAGVGTTAIITLPAEVAMPGRLEATAARN